MDVSLGFKSLILIVLGAILSCSSMLGQNHPLVKTNTKGMYVLPNTCTEPFLECCYPNQFDSLPEVGKNGVIGIWTQADIDTFLKYRKKGEEIHFEAIVAMVLSIKKDSVFFRRYYGNYFRQSDKIGGINTFYINPAYIELRKGVFRLNYRKCVERYYDDKFKRYMYHNVDGSWAMYDSTQTYYEIDTIKKTMSFYDGNKLKPNDYYTFNEKGKYYKKLSDLYHKLSYYLEDCKAADTATVGRWVGSMGGYFRLFYKNKKYYMMETFDMDEGEGQYYQVDVSPHPKGLKVQMHLHDSSLYHNPLYEAYKATYDVIEFDNNNRLAGYFEDKRVSDGYRFMRCYSYNAEYDAMYYQGIDTMPRSIKFEEPVIGTIEAMRKMYQEK